MRKIPFFLLFVAIPFLFCGKKPIVDFYQEKITIEIDSASALVQGEYFFANNTDSRKIVKFFYPFPVDSNHYYPDIIMLDYPYEKDTNGIYFSMPIKPGKENSFKIGYRQRLNKRYFRYITTTTRKWGKSINTAEFFILARKDLKLHINYKITKTELRNNMICYTIVMKRFYPTQDLIIKW
ncbi:MAG: hypothetical protein ABIL69_10360 [candidate division WOR-3 bacterium]